MTTMSPKLRISVDKPWEKKKTKTFKDENYKTWNNLNYQEKKLSNLEKVQLTLFNQKNGKTEELRSIVEEVEKWNLRKSFIGL